MEKNNEESSTPEAKKSDSTVSVDSIEIINEKNGAEEDEQWLIGGPLGAKGALLVFRSSALANSSPLSIQRMPAYKLHITYKVSQAETKLLSKLLNAHGVSEITNNSCDFNLLWTGSHPRPGLLRSLTAHQRVNHFPRSYELTRKDRLYKNIEKMQHIRGLKNFNFIPQTFVMPGEFRDLCLAHYRVKGPWIVKPVASSRGRGIFIVESPNQVPLDEPVVVAKYVNKPLLIRGHKCDLRLYVAVTSYDPLLIYIYEEGLVRFATVKYDPNPKSLWNPCMHLCNYSINKYHSDYVKADDPNAENVGHKWTLSALLRHLKTEGKNTSNLMSQIEDMVIKAVLASASSIVSASQMFVPNPACCFELFGFDILIDEGLKPWLLEVNLSPSLGCDSPLDVRLKSAMLADLLTLVGIPAVDPVLRSPSTTSNTSNKHVRHNQVYRMKFASCRRVHSADGLSSKPSSSSQSSRHSSNCLSLTPEESRIIKSARAQFERRGGFVRIFPTIDSWAKYSCFLDTISGVPVNGLPTGTYGLVVPHNYNLLLFQHLFPGVPLTTKLHDKEINRLTDRKSSMDRSKEPKMTISNRQDRYERQLREGYKSSLNQDEKLPLPLKETQSEEIKKQVFELMKSGKKLSQIEARKMFSQYLVRILRRLSSSPNQEGHIEIVFRFLQRASSYVRLPFCIKMPQASLLMKDKAAIVAKQLNDFLHLYNRETELYCTVLDSPNQLPTELFTEFLEYARESDLEEVLAMQTLHTVPKSQAISNASRILKNVPVTTVPMIPKFSTTNTNKVKKTQP
ncbi:tubulin polyglutamylase TTLL5 isoform X2 [Agrilus planipennis]|uniref:Tubulin--tyrosine ligase-like protein 5 n=1 Tax=Agrilus planipennis TaxID=224129 RepID=A0A1W4X548_AGRPL|nr:tubulin polyglutamylase TTLL5 isoform X2 [Agrilus planipennis]